MGFLGLLFDLLLGTSNKNNDNLWDEEESLFEENTGE